VGDLITLIGTTEQLGASAAVLARGYEARPMAVSDADAVGSLYFAAYDPGEACDTLEESVADVVMSLDGDYGPFWAEASPVIGRGSQVVAAVMTVRRAPWHDTPDCPFIIEVFTDRAHRRRGLARFGIGWCLRIVREAGESSVALRVMDDNTPALALYESLGFTPWKPVQHG